LPRHIEHEDSLMSATRGCRRPCRFLKGVRHLRARRPGLLGLSEAAAPAREPTARASGASASGAAMTRTSNTSAVDASAWAGKRKRHVVLASRDRLRNRVLDIEELRGMVGEGSVARAPVTTMSNTRRVPRHPIVHTSVAGASGFTFSR